MLTLALPTDAAVSHIESTARHAAAISRLLSSQAPDRAYAVGAVADKRPMSFSHSWQHDKSYM